MRQKAVRLSLIAALLLGAGTHLFFLQAYAWAAMTVSNMRAAPAAEAVGKTFDGRHPCALCLKVRKASGSQQKREAQRPGAKLALLFQPLSYGADEPSFAGRLPGLVYRALPARPFIDTPPPKSALVA